MSEKTKTICAWCGKLLQGDDDATIVSHGICDDCLDKKRKDSLREFVNNDKED